MLRTLRVSDLAIIDEVELVLEPGFNVLTGETGAGKSILLAALDVALGGRPEADLVRTGAEEAVVEALFAEVPAAAREVLAAAGIGGRDTDELIVRRVITAGGRTRAYVNGSLGSLGLLRELAPHLVRVYGQDEHQTLRRVESHREMLDGVAGLGGTVEEMRRRHALLVRAREALAACERDRKASVERQELVRFQLDELTKAELQAGEDEALERERTRLQHVEKLVELAGGAECTLYSCEGAVVERLGQVLAALREVERIDEAVTAVRTLVESALAELEDAGGSLGRYTRGLEVDPARLETVRERLAFLARLEKKYGGSLEDLIRRRDELAVEVGATADGDERLVSLTADVAAAEREGSEWAKRLSVERRRAAHQLERSLVRELRALAMEDARFTVQFADPDTTPLGPTGRDEVEFYLTANRGEEARPLARVASGGELSRVMLALKTLAAADDAGATLIFDEVDSGVGGRVAEVVGSKLRQLGRRRQVLSVTHLPVIAAFADHHVVVSKRVVGDRTVSTAHQLTASERVTELARMLAGARLTPEAREHAQELLRAGGRGVERVP
jgi:DNA repair protein RecN (Recombination protein N)